MVAKLLEAIFLRTLLTPLILISLAHLLAKLQKPLPKIHFFQVKAIVTLIKFRANILKLPFFNFTMKIHFQVNEE